MHRLVGGLSQHSEGFIHPNWCRISSIHGILRRPYCCRSTARGSHKTMKGDKAPICSCPFRGRIIYMSAVSVVHANAVVVGHTMAEGFHYPQIATPKQNASLSSQCPRLPCLLCWVCQYRWICHTMAYPTPKKQSRPKRQRIGVLKSSGLTYLPDEVRSYPVVQKQSGRGMGQLLLS